METLSDTFEIESIQEVLLEDFTEYKNPDNTPGGLVHNTAEVGDNVYIGKDSYVFEGAKVRSGSSIGSDAVIEAGAWVCRNSLIKNGLVVTANSIFSNDC